MIVPTQPLPWPGMGNVLGEVAAAITCLTLEEFVRELRCSGSPLRQFLMTARGARQNPSSRRTWTEVQAALVEDPHPRWMSELLNVTFGLYRLFRWRASPTLALPEVDPRGRFHLPRDH